MIYDTIYPSYLGLLLLISNVKAVFIVPPPVCTHIPIPVNSGCFR